LAASFPNALVHAFEPEPGNCDVLRANARALPRIQVHEFALGGEDGELVLFGSDDSANMGEFSGHARGYERACLTSSW
jgi:FkbM family methyltransferase